MKGDSGSDEVRNLRLTRVLICLMFLTFAMTSDAVGAVIPRIIDEFRLSMKAASAFHYAPMMAIAFAALLLGFLADRFGRKRTIVLGLILYAVSCFAFAFGQAFGLFVGLLAISGLGISIFKIGALALVGDVTSSVHSHTKLMNTAEGFFAVGSIVGPAVVALLLSQGLSWKWLYVTAAVLCGVLVLIAARINYPQVPSSAQAASLRNTFRLLKDPYALGFSLLITLYVAVEVRALGRFLAVWLLARFSWTAVLAVFGIVILACFAGAAAGIILFFTASSAALGPLAMGAVSDAYDDPRSGFVLATGFALLLGAGLLVNWWADPAARRLQVFANDSNVGK